MKFYNTLHRKREEFIPLQNGKVSLYTCGPTVYDFAHIGNLRAFLFEDILRRYLELKGFEVLHVMNITDIDDKTIRRSQEEGKPLINFTAEYTQSFFDDLQTLNILTAHHYPRATDFIPQMISTIQTLEAKGFTYTAEDGSVFYKSSQFPNYGMLANLDPEQLKSGERVAEDEYEKEEGRDFALWKGYKPEDGDVCWDSPWGKGRPGWHIECSVMSTHYLGDHFDIHCGGVDNIFPHHENEIAQSCCANKTEKFANYWLHNGFVTFDKEKMSKSTGNIVSINKLRENVNGQVVRLALLSSHYKQPLDWNEKLIKESQNTLDKWYGQFEEINTEELKDDVLKPLQEDLNTPEYIAKLHSLFEDSSKGNKLSKIKFLSGCRQIGLLEDKHTWENFKKSKAKVDENFINQKIKDRNEARKKGNYKLADTLRKELEDNSVIIEDRKDKTTWKYK